MNAYRIFQIAGSLFGALFFAGHAGMMLYFLPFAMDRETRFEYIGKIVPGFAGLLLLLVIWCQHPIVKIEAAVLALFVLILGRATYELLVFQKTS